MMRRIPSCIAGGVLIVLLGFAAGCDWVTKDAPKQARIRIEGAPDAEFELVTSTKFLTSSVDGTGDGSGGTVVVLQGDTTTIDVPYEETFDIRVDQRFFAQVRRSNPGSDELTMQGWVDGETKFERDGAAVPADSLVRFTYIFRTNTGSPDDSNL